MCQSNLEMSSFSNLELTTRQFLLKRNFLFSPSSSRENRYDFRGDPAEVLRREAAKGSSLNKEAGLPRRFFESPRKDEFFYPSLNSVGWQEFRNVRLTFSLSYDKPNLALHIKEC